jgi:hypothetical protein
MYASTLATSRREAQAVVEPDLRSFFPEIDRFSAWQKPFTETSGNEKASKAIRGGFSSDRVSVNLLATGCVKRDR